MEGLRASLRDRAFAPLSELWSALNPDNRHHIDMVPGVVDSFVAIGVLLGYGQPEVCGRKDMPLVAAGPKEDLARLLEITKDATVKASELTILEDRIGDIATDLFEQMLKGNWRDDHGHDVGKNIKMAELKQIVEGILKARGVK
jgi:hypothetical protein